MANFDSSSAAIIVFLLIFSAVGTCTAAPAVNRSGCNETNEADNPQFVLDAGLLETAQYILNRSRDDNPLTPPLDIATEELPIESLCDVLMYYELANKVDNSSDLSTLLRQNVYDSCRWVKFLVDSCDIVQWNSGYIPEQGSGSGSIPQPSDCTADDITLLHTQCLRMRLSSIIWFKNVITPVHLYIFNRM